MKRIENFIEFMLESGLIFEINRNILHPLGLVLEADIRENENGKQEVYLKLWECPADDDVGFLFPPDSLKFGMEKYSKYLRDKGQSRLEKRKKALGYSIQEE